mmetsp:Transcript_54547/g.107735  ORF Transcript_54547/g.107735 Transcript_54547/m.107735 type:complete len:220 (-) Transcript_54547:41-700(-)
MFRHLDHLLALGLRVYLWLLSALGWYSDRGDLKLGEAIPASRRADLRLHEPDELHIDGTILMELLGHSKVPEREFHVKRHILVVAEVHRDLARKDQRHDRWKRLPECLPSGRNRDCAHQVAHAMGSQARLRNATDNCGRRHFLSKVNLLVFQALDIDGVLIWIVALSMDVQNNREAATESDLGDLDRPHLADDLIVQRRQSEKQIRQYPTEDEEHYADR